MSHLISAQEWSEHPIVYGTGEAVLQGEDDYKYDVFGNRVEKDVTVDSTTTVQRYAYDGWNPAKSNPVGSVAELHGVAVALILPSPKTTNGDHATESWTDAKNSRRGELIDQRFSTGLTLVETVELARLQEQMLRYRRKYAPLPLEDARRLHQELLNRASAGRPSE